MGGWWWCVLRWLQVAAAAEVAVAAAAEVAVTAAAEVVAGRGGNSPMALWQHGRGGMCVVVASAAAPGGGGGGGGGGCRTGKVGFCPCKPTSSPLSTGA